MQPKLASSDGGAGMKASRNDADGAIRAALRIPARLTHRGVAIALVSGFVEALPGATRDFRNEVVTAFGEVFNNLVIHGYADASADADAGAGPEVDVEAVATAESLTLHISDTGQEIDFTKIEMPDLGALPESGMGIFMIHALVDEVSYRAGSPNELTLVKRLPPSST